MSHEIRTLEAETDSFYKRGDEISTSTLVTRLESHYDDEMFSL